jgi:hypothetical protein
MSDTPRHGFRKIYPKNSSQYKSFISKKRENSSRVRSRIQKCNKEFLITGNNQIIYFEM